MNRPAPIRLIALLCCCWLGASLCAAQTDTFVDRRDAGDLRVASFNIYRDAIFGPGFGPGADAQTADRFARIVNAIKPDVLALQEIYNHSAAETALLLDTVAPLPGGAGWYTHEYSDNIIASRFPFHGVTGQVGHADALIDLPDDQYASDFYLISDHLPCCTDEEGRQTEADRLVRWLDGMRTPGVGVEIASQTPFAVVGDFNIVGSGRPLETLLTGDIVNEWIGPDSPPDWDGTPITDAHPRQNASGPEDYTWRNDSSEFEPGVLDYVLFSDSVLETANRFVLNTTTMTPTELAATGLEANDVLITAGDGFFDHLPLVVDFRWRPETLAGDYDRDGSVTPADHATWAAQYGADAAPPADGNGDGRVDAADYTVWRDALSSAEAASVPEPATLLSLFLLGVGTATTRQRPMAA